MGAVVVLVELARHRAEWRLRGQRLVLTNGCFDIIHLGHVRYLQAARALGDVLVVGVNSDASTRRLKGERRPIVSQAARAEVLAALGCVDFVIVFDEDTAEALVAALRPEVYVKGGDYATARGEQSESSKPLPEAAVVERYGGRVAILPEVAGASSTGIVERIIERYCDRPPA